MCLKKCWYNSYVYGLDLPPDITEQTAELLIPSSKFSENMNGLITGAAVFDRITKESVVWKTKE